MSPGGDDRNRRGRNARRHGRWAEIVSLWLLRLKGYSIVAHGHVTGRGTGAGEIDIVARRGRLLAFVEVKSRSSRSLAATAISRNGKYLAYGVSTGGSDWVDVHVMEIATRKVEPETLKWVKVSGLAWAKDGFYYSRYPAPEAGHELTTKNEFHQVYFHKVGTPQTDDALVYEDKANPRRFHTLATTEDCLTDPAWSRDGKTIAIAFGPPAYAKPSESS